MMTVDGKERVTEFLARHGGRGAESEREGDGGDPGEGWSEVYAADGHVLRCDWSSVCGVTHVRFSEMAPDLRPRSP
jgi:hypothetical protein